MWYTISSASPAGYFEMMMVQNTKKNCTHVARSDIIFLVSISSTACTTTIWPSRACDRPALALGWWEFCKINLFVCQGLCNQFLWDGWQTRQKGCLGTAVAATVAPFCVSSCTRRTLMYVPTSAVEPLPSPLLLSKPLTPVALSLPPPGSSAPARKENGGLFITASSKNKQGAIKPHYPVTPDCPAGGLASLYHTPLCAHWLKSFPGKFHTLRWMERILTCIGRVARIGASSWRSLPEFGRYTLYDGVQCSLAQLDGIALF